MKTTALVAFIGLLAGQGAHAEGFVVTSPQIKKDGRIADEQVFNNFGCQGGNVSPALHWKGAPAGTQSFAVTVYDQDAPTGSGWWHWVVFNIPASTNTVNRNASDPKAGLCPSAVSRAAPISAVRVTAGRAHRSVTSRTVMSLRCMRSR